MKTALVAVSVIALAGCAASPERLRAAAATDSNDTLCMVQIVKPQYAQYARDELASRGATCDWERTRAQAQVYVQQRQASDDASTALALQLLQNSGPRTLQNPQLSPARTITPMGMLRSERVNGWLRYCSYSNGLITTVSSSEICPMNTN